MQILDKGQLGLVDSMGTDRRIAEAAWVSYGKQEQDKPIEPVINYMMRHKHGTPFEHVVFTFYVKTPIFVAREWMRHRIGSFNEISGRYVTFQPEFYIPERLRVRGSTNKQGSIFPDDEWFTEKGKFDSFLGLEDFEESGKDILEGAYNQAYQAYEDLLSEDIANEIARIALPVGLYTQFYWTVNLRALFNFINLRSAETAQWEIQQYSKAIEEILKEKVPVAYQAFIDANRQAP